MAASLSKRVLRTFGSFTALGRSNASIISVSKLVKNVPFRLPLFSNCLSVSFGTANASGNGLSSRYSDLKVGVYITPIAYNHLVFTILEMLISFFFFFLLSIKCSVEWVYFQTESSPLLF